MVTAPPVPVRLVTQDDVDKAYAAIRELERTERLVTSTLVTLGLGGLIFTAVNVTLFAVRHAVHWAIAWLLDPLVSLALLAVLFFDGRLAAHGFRPRGWPFALRWFAGLATWLMNSWESLYPDGVFTGIPARPDVAGLVLHSVIPFLVIILAEAASRYRAFISVEKSKHLITISDWKAQEYAAAQAEAQRLSDQEAERRAAVEEEHRRTAELTAERERARIAAEERAAEVAGREREIRATAEMELRLAAQRAQDKTAGAALAAEVEARRVAAVAAEAERALKLREAQAAIDAETAERAARLERERIAAEGSAEAERIRAQDEVRAAAEAREERRRIAEARRSATAETAMEHPQKPRRAPAVSPAVSPAGSGTAPAETEAVQGREARRQQIVEANFEAAVLITLDATPTRSEFASRYDRSEAWARERHAEAERLLSEDEEFQTRVLAEAEARTTQDAVHGV